MDNEEIKRQLRHALQSRIDVLSAAQRRLVEIDDEPAAAAAHGDSHLAVAGAADSSLLPHPVPVASGDHQQHQDPDDDDDLDAPFNSMQLGYQENAAEQAYHDVAGDGAGELGMELDPDVAFQDDDDDMWMQSPGVEATPDTRFTDDGGFGGVPASAAAIAGLKKKRYDGSSSGADDDDTCVICMREYKKGKKLFVMPCAFKHRFHRKCLKKWLARSHLCPLCRHALPTEDTSVHRSSI
ncbi:hypothetical protein HU200_030831 [Digitaria exilis]|uniref:RING-type domain-containing protein n=1 Tax=Digitaria exilis TaxID=1010633 RepID=A0A835BR43_9POAL|nr:hypothetical protein HU200_030831 [Digitaria exilis]